VSKASGALAITTKSSRSRKKARKNLNENPRKCRNYGTLFGAGEKQPATKAIISQFGTD